MWSIRFLFDDQRGRVVGSSSSETAALKGGESELFWKMTNLVVRFPHLEALLSVRRIRVEMGVGMEMEMGLESGVANQ